MERTITGWFPFPISPLRRCWRGFLLRDPQSCRQHEWDVTDGIVLGLNMQCHSTTRRAAIATTTKDPRQLDVSLSVSECRSHLSLVFILVPLICQVSLIVSLRRKK